MSYSDLSGNTWDLTVNLTDDQADILNHALRQVYLFDGLDLCGDDTDSVCDILVLLGYDDPRKDGSYECDTCGKVGNADDGCEYKGDCPDEDCNGTMREA